MQTSPTRLLRFADLKAAGIVNNWPQLGRLQKLANFPAGFLLSPNCRVWEAAEIDAWVASRKAAGQQREPSASHHTEAHRSTPAA